MYKIVIRYDSENGYFLLFYINKLPIFTDKGLIRYCNLSEDFWFSNLKKFNCTIFSYGIFFKNHIDCDNARKWIEDNLDYFLILRKLGGN